jgi:hypothetical protein
MCAEQMNIKHTLSLRKTPNEPLFTNNCNINFHHIIEHIKEKLFCVLAHVVCKSFMFF